MLQGQIEKYSWANEIEAWTVAAVKGRTVDEVISIYGGDSADPIGTYHFAQMFDLQGDDPYNLKFHVQTFNRPPYVVVIENNGWSGSVPEIARRCSADDGQFFSVFWSLTGSGAVTQAIDGVVTAHFAALYPFSLEPPQPGDLRPDWATGPALDVELAWPACMALLEQQTGMAFDPSWLTEQRPTYRIPDAHWLLRDVEGTDRP